jgi:hypothetical protein
MERIYLTKEEKMILRHIAKGERKAPGNITPNMYLYHLATLQEKGLAIFQEYYDEVHRSRLTTKGKAYIESNPKLHNPTDWKGIISLVAVLVSAAAASLALFISCCLARQ